jgi:hypothetical protein
MGAALSDDRGASASMDAKEAFHIMMKRRRSWKVLFGKQWGEEYAIRKEFLGRQWGDIFVIRSIRKRCHK